MELLLILLADVAASFTAGLICGLVGWSPRDWAKRYWDDAGIVEIAFILMIGLQILLPFTAGLRRGERWRSGWARDR